jgi:alpha-D-xyloside xylohydrolase
MTIEFPSSARLGRCTLLALAAAATLAGCGTDPPPRGMTVRVQTKPFGVSILRDGRTVVGEDVAPGARLRFEVAPDNYEYSLTRVLSSHGMTYRVGTTEPGRTATVTVKPTTTGAEILVALHPATDVTEVYDAFGTTPGEHFLGGGERGQQVDLRGQVLPVSVSYLCSYAPVPFFMSSAGWGLRIASYRSTALAFPGSAGGGGCQSRQAQGCTFPPLTGSVEVCEQGPELDEHLYVGSFAQTLADYEAETGTPTVPPPSELALIKWRDVVSGPGDVLEDVTRLQAAKIPIGWVELDNPWEPCNGDLTFNRKLIPDPKALIAAVHRRDVRFMLWISPRAICANGYPGKPLGPVGSQVLDLRDPAVVREFEARIRALVDIGVDGVKADRGDEVDLSSVSPTLTNTYPLLFAHAVMSVLPKGAAAIFRAGTPGSQSVVPGMWAGDQPEEFVGLQRAIIAGETAAMSGFPTWGSDVGGYAGPPYVDTDLFVRWAQLGAVSPVLEVGGKGENATPWLLGPTAMAGLRGAAVLHYELFPYLYGLLEGHRSVIEPLGYAYPNDSAAWGAAYEFMVGPDLLAAPVTGPGTTPSVVLPPGRWIDLFTGRTVEGGGPAFTRPTALLQFPLYARSGTVFPFNLRTRTASWWGVDEQTHPGRAGFLAATGTSLHLTGQPHDVQIFVPAPSRPRRVTLAGNAVSWRWNAGPFPGVVIRVHGPRVEGAIALTS